ncbi:MAG TPA: PQQ-dependent sugar dehydrogenase [Actinomycetota bacterium]|jgi:Glucose / Sorbosone dehydrogenase
MRQRPRPPRRASRRGLAVLTLVPALLAGLGGGTPALRALAVPRQAASTDPATVQVSLVRFATAEAPTAIAASPDASGRLFVTELAGRVRLIEHRRVVARPYLDIRRRVLSGGERGLLSLAFHPRFARNGWFFVAYTGRDGDVRVSRFRAGPSAAVASAASEAVVMEVPHHRFANHNGGQLAFGPDGYLYVSTGDGGGAGDPDGNAQNRTSLLGKVLRIDVDRTSPGRRYAIPPGNPYANHPTARHEIWHYGLRNPWRVSFDRFGSQWIADVGQDDREEVDVVGRGVGDRNLGWDCREGRLDTSARYGGAYCAARAGWFSPPLLDYQLLEPRCSVIGGYRYRGRAYRSLLLDSYVYADYCSGEIWALAHLPDGRWTNEQVGFHAGNISSFGENRVGELFAADLRGGIYRLTARRQ